MCSAPRLPFDQGTPLEGRFRAFDEANPHVFDELLEIAREVRDRGVKRIGIAFLFERLRWRRMKTHGDPYRLNNSYRAFYARKLMAADPALADLFETRASAHDPNYYARIEAAS